MNSTEHGGGAPIRKKIRAQVKLISQGAYGCVYRPSIQCNGRPGKTKNFVSKLQLKSTADNEIAIGAKLTKIPNFNFHFAPIIRSCPVQLAKLDQNTMLNSCNVVKKDSTREQEFVLNRIRFVGTDTLETYINNRIHRGYLILKFFELHQFLLRSVTHMVEQSVVHFDLKENNIIYDAKNHVPIIIDFGMSVDMTFLSGNQLELYDSGFHIYYEKYPPWCLDIVICSFLVQKSVHSTTPHAWAKQTVDIDQLLKIVDLYYSGNDIIHTLSKLGPTAIAAIKQSHNKWNNFVRTQCAGKNGKEVVDMIASSGWKTWDNFGMAVIFITMWIRYDLAKMVSSPELYQQLMVTLITSLPNERPTADITNNELAKITKLLTKNNYTPTPAAI